MKNNIGLISVLGIVSSFLLLGGFAVQDNKFFTGELPFDPLQFDEVHQIDVMKVQFSDSGDLEVFNVTKNVMAKVVEADLFKTGDKEFIKDRDEGIFYLLNKEDCKKEVRLVNVNAITDELLLDFESCRNDLYGEGGILELDEVKSVLN